MNEEKSRNFAFLKTKQIIRYFGLKNNADLIKGNFTKTIKFKIRLNFYISIDNSYGSSSLPIFNSFYFTL